MYNLCYYKPNAKGTGSACRFELNPAHEEIAGSISMQLAMQKTVGSSQEAMFFDWENGITISLDRKDLSQIIQVFKGMRESVNDGKGIFHQSANASILVKFYHQIDPVCGYALSASSLSASSKTMDGILKECRFFFDVDEAITLELSLERAMMYVCFGIPEVFNW